MTIEESCRYAAQFMAELRQAREQAKADAWKLSKSDEQFLKSIKIAR